MPRRLILAMALFSCGAAYGEPPVAAFAPGQLRFAERELQRAEEALARGDYDLARQLAAQAGLDARIAWGMSDSAFLRRDAAALHEDSARLRWLAAREGLSAAR